jgi:hypothetical protein
MYAESPIYTDKLFVDGHQNVWEKSSNTRGFYLKLYFNQIGPKIKKWEPKVKKTIILTAFLVIELMVLCSSLGFLIRDYI